jgi:RNA polymerase sigma-70 factor (ECF subfamily)
MRRCCGDTSLADDLAQQVFLQVWLKIRTLKKANAFGGWLKKLAISIWLQHLRKNDTLKDADELGDAGNHESTSVRMDLDRALATLSDTVRGCIVLSYHEGMSHAEIASAMDLPLGTVKSHISRGAEQLQQMLTAYKDIGFRDENGGDHNV